jgi:hypothetical protein
LQVIASVEVVMAGLEVDIAVAVSKELAVEAMEAEVIVTAVEDSEVAMEEAATAVAGLGVATD